MLANIANNTRGTRNVGNNIKGKNPSAMFGCSKPNNSNRSGKESSAVETTFINNIRQIIFQIIMNLLLNLFLTKPK